MSDESLSSSRKHFNGEFKLDSEPNSHVYMDESDPGLEKEIHDQVMRDYRVEKSLSEAQYITPELISGTSRNFDSPILYKRELRTAQYGRQMRNLKTLQPHVLNVLASYDGHRLSLSYFERVQWSYLLNDYVMSDLAEVTHLHGIWAQIFWILMNMLDIDLCHDAPDLTRFLLNRVPCNSNICTCPYTVVIVGYSNIRELTYNCIEDFRVAFEPNLITVEQQLNQIWERNPCYGTLIELKKIYQRAVDIEKRPPKQRPKDLLRNHLRRLFNDMVEKSRG